MVLRDTTFQKIKNLFEALRGMTFQKISTMKKSCWCKCEFNYSLVPSVKA
jgi:hypothetical protein